MTGTLINIITVLIGGTLGLLFGARLPERLKATVIAGLGLFTAAIGVQMFLKTENALIVLGAILIGALLGEWWQIEDGLQNLGRTLESRFTPGPSTSLRTGPEPASASGILTSTNFVRGFLTASLLFCVGPMTILGSIQDGLTGNYELLAVKSVLDGFASLAFASTLGVGVLFSTIVILVFQGGISLLAVQLNALVTTPMLNEMTAAGGVILMGLAISSLLEIKKIRVGNFLPALAVAPLIVWVLSLLGI
jgi:uncharacterized membrane protein YqgA involved in biofilm formation